MAPAMPVNEEMQKADEYLKRHRIVELFGDLTTAVCFHQPTDVRKFLVQELARREKEGAEAGAFSDQEIDAVFRLADLRSIGAIHCDQARAALCSMTRSQKQLEAARTMQLAEELDAATFKAKAQELLALN
eukprot:TRINITY_DN32346_c0_g1_i1.p1 TRINITY_DN32346_c0_g1~~TRINITY_DN32346_c0_g1_i1.p1  ORF type:complete len:152 (-),score=51.42 TRINITY_DN32346_c0_g1_i1:82-474(-)